MGKGTIMQAKRPERKRLEILTFVYLEFHLIRFPLAYSFSPPSSWKSSFLLPPGLVAVFSCYSWKCKFSTNRSMGKTAKIPRYHPPPTLHHQDVYLLARNPQNWWSSLPLRKGHRNTTWHTRLGRNCATVPSERESRL